MEIGRRCERANLMLTRGGNRRWPRTCSPHTALHEHYEKIFDHQCLLEPLSLNPSTSPDISEAELDWALRRGKSGKSVGVDGVSLELLKAICSQPRGKDQILAWYNSILHTGEIPKDWSESLMVLLPKVRLPEKAGHTRPIAVGCAAEKIFCRIVLERTKSYCSVKQPWQCCAPGRQSCDYIHTIHRLMESEREWQRGLSIMKIDFTRAFDSVDRQKLLSQIFSRMGDSEEYRIWERIMVRTRCTLRTAWDQTSFNTNVGIRQGAVESPFFFGSLVEWIVQGVATKHAKGTSTYPDMPVSQAAYMDDLLIWDGNSQRVQKKLLL